MLEDSGRWMVRSCKLQLMPVRKHVVFKIICLRGEAGVGGDRGHHLVKRTHRCRHRRRSRAPPGRAYTWSMMIAFNLADICICSQINFVNDFRVCFLPHCSEQRHGGHWLGNSSNLMSSLLKTRLCCTLKAELHFASFCGSSEFIEALWHTQSLKVSPLDQNLNNHPYL